MTRRIATTLLPIALMFGLTACSASWDMQGNDPVEYYADHPIKNSIEPRNAAYIIRFAPAKNRLSDSDIDRLHSQMHAISMASVDAVHVTLSKSDSTNELRKDYLGRLMRNMGYTKSDIVFDVSPDIAKDHMVLAVDYAVVVSPDCPDWRMSPVTSYSNTHQGNFYCSQEVNLGLMVADPHDLVGGAGDVPMDTQRAAKAVQNYHEGVVPTPAASSSGSSGASSTGGATTTAAPAAQ